MGGILPAMKSVGNYQVTKRGETWIRFGLVEYPEQGISTVLLASAAFGALLLLLYSFARLQRRSLVRKNQARILRYVSDAHGDVGWAYTRRASLLLSTEY